MVRLTQLFFYLKSEGGGGRSGVVCFLSWSYLCGKSVLSGKIVVHLGTERKTNKNFSTENGVTRRTFYWLKRITTNFCQDGCDLAKILLPAAADYRGDNILLLPLWRQEEGLQQEPNGKTHGKVSIATKRFFLKKVIINKNYPGIVREFEFFHGPMSGLTIRSQIAW